MINAVQGWWAYMDPTYEIANASFFFSGGRMVVLWFAYKMRIFMSRIKQKSNASTKQTLVKWLLKFGCQISC